MCTRGEELNTSILQLLLPYTLSSPLPSSPSPTPNPHLREPQTTCIRDTVSRSAIHVTLAAHRMKRDSQPADISSYKCHVPCCPVDSLLSPAITGTAAFLPQNSNYCSGLEREKRTQLGTSSLILTLYVPLGNLCYMHSFRSIALCHLLLPRDFFIAFVLGSGIQQFPLTYHPPGLEWQEVGRMILYSLGFKCCGIRSCLFILAS